MDIKLTIVTLLENETKGIQANNICTFVWWIED